MALPFELLLFSTLSVKWVDHRRRMETEFKAKVVASVWGAKFVKFLAALAVVSRFERNVRIKPFLPNRLDELNRFFQLDRGKTASAAKNWTNVVPQTDATTFALPSVSILLLWGRSTFRYSCDRWRRRKSLMAVPTQEPWHSYISVPCHPCFTSYSLISSSPSLFSALYGVLRTNPV